MDWALEYAPPMPSQLVATLAGLARHADKKGRGAYPSVARLAAYTCKSQRSVQRDLAELRKLGLIRLGNQSKAAHLPEGKRPEVYDLAMERIVPEGRAGRDEVTRTSLVTLTSSRARGGRKKSSSDAMSSDSTGDVHVTPDVHVTGDAHVADGVTPTSQRGDAHVTQTKKMNLKTEPAAAGTVDRDNRPAGEQASSSDNEDRIPDAFAYIQPLITAMTAAGFASLSWQMTTDDLQAVARVLKRTSATAMVENAVGAKSRTRKSIGFASYFLKSGWLGLPPRSLAAPTPRPSEKPPYCGDTDCDPVTRFRDVEDDRGLRYSQPCPKCHPTARKDSAA
jgi:hypothetical protein